MQIDVLTIFPEYLEPLRHALLGRAIEQGHVDIRVHNVRDWASGVHQSVDGAPCGGGPGMVMKPTVWGAALDDVYALKNKAGQVKTLDSSTPHLERLLHDQKKGHQPQFYGTDDADDAKADESDDRPLLLVPTPAARPFTQADARAWSREKRLVFACGRYEGIDSRVVEDARRRYRVREVSIGDYVLIGGEVAVLVIAEAVIRLIPGVLGNHQSHEEDSFSDGLLEGPCYTKPRSWRGLDVPDILFSGHHAKIARWRRDQALLKTQQCRPELLEQVDLSERDQQCLAAGISPEEDATG